jgi:hypothetical protein
MKRKGIKPMKSNGAKPFSGQAALSSNPPRREMKRSWYFLRLVIMLSLSSHKVVIK